MHSPVELTRSGDASVYTSSLGNLMVCFVLGEPVQGARRSLRDAERLFRNSVAGSVYAGDKLVSAVRLHTLGAGSAAGVGSAFQGALVEHALIEVLDLHLGIVAASFDTTVHAGLVRPTVFGALEDLHAGLVAAGAVPRTGCAGFTQGGLACVVSAGGGASAAVRGTGFAVFGLIADSVSTPRRTVLWTGGGVFLKGTGPVAADWAVLRAIVGRLTGFADTVSTDVGTDHPVAGGEGGAAVLDHTGIAFGITGIGTLGLALSVHAGDDVHGGRLCLDTALLVTFLHAGGIGTVVQTSDIGATITFAAGAVRTACAAGFLVSRLAGPVSAVGGTILGTGAVVFAWVADVVAAFRPPASGCVDETDVVAGQGATIEPHGHAVLLTEVSGVAFLAVLQNPISALPTAAAIFFAGFTGFVAVALTIAAGGADTAVLGAGLAVLRAGTPTISAFAAVLHAACQVFALVAGAIATGAVLGAGRGGFVLGADSVPASLGAHRRVVSACDQAACCEEQGRGQGRQDKGFSQRFEE